MINKFWVHVHVGIVILTEMYIHNITQILCDFDVYII